MSKPKIKITLVDRIGKCSCHRGHGDGDTFEYGIDRGKLCPMAIHVSKNEKASISRLQTMAKVYPNLVISG